MMLHRHFESERSKNITKLSDFNAKEEFVSEVFQPDESEVIEEAPKKRGRPKKTDE